MVVGSTGSELGSYWVDDKEARALNVGLEKTRRPRSL
jgi:hypothetical protein